MKTIKTLFALGLFFVMFLHLQSEEKQTKNNVIRTEITSIDNNSIKSIPTSSSFEYQKVNSTKY